MKKNIALFLLSFFVLTGCSEVSNMSLGEVVQKGNQSVANSILKETSYTPGEEIFSIGNEKYIYTGGFTENQISVAYIGYSILYESYYAYNAYYSNKIGTIINLPETGVQIKIISYDQETNNIVFSKVE